MTNEEMDIAVAEACGWKQSRIGWWMHPTLPDNGGAEPLPPDYGSDLNAMHEAEKILTKEQQEFFYFFLFELAPCDENHGPVVPDGEDLMTPSGFSMLHASAGQRREAFLRTVCLFIEPEDQRKPEASQSSSEAKRA